MGYSVEMMALFTELGERGHLNDVRRVVDLGSQQIHFARQDGSSSSCKESLRRAIRALGGSSISDDQLDKLANRSSAGEFYSLASKEYKALDADGWYGDPFDFNLDTVSKEDRNAFCLTVNAGTTEHLIDQENVFRIVHDLTRRGGLMLHAVPFLGGIDHGFFNYNPNFFSALAKFNSYELLGLWLSPVGTFTLMPWSDSMVKHLKAATDPEYYVLLYCLLRKTNDLEFCIPFQSGYESEQHPDNLNRYSYNVDGRLVSGTYAVQLSAKQGFLANVPGKALLSELSRRIRRRFTGKRD
jgi:hypothetical protein